MSFIKQGQEVDILNLISNEILMSGYLIQYGIEKKLWVFEMLLNQAVYVLNLMGTLLMAKRTRIAMEDGC